MALSQRRLSCVVFNSLPSKCPEYKNPSFSACRSRLSTTEISEFSELIFHKPLQPESSSSAKAVYTLLPATGWKPICSASNFQGAPSMDQAPTLGQVLRGSQRRCAVRDTAAALGSSPARKPYDARLSSSPALWHLSISISMQDFLPNISWEIYVLLNPKAWETSIEYLGKGIIILLWELKPSNQPRDVTGSKESTASSQIKSKKLTCRVEG